MIAAGILSVSALVCVIGVVVSVYYGLKLRHEECAPLFAIGAGICIFLAGLCVSEAVSSANRYEKQRLEYQEIPKKKG